MVASIHASESTWPLCFSLWLRESGSTMVIGTKGLQQEITLLGSYTPPEVLPTQEAGLLGTLMSKIIQIITAKSTCS